MEGVTAHGAATLIWRSTIRLWRLTDRNRLGWVKGNGVAETLGVGIVGLVRIGWFHAQQLLSGISGARLVAAAVDSDHQRRLLASGEAPCALVDDVEALLALPDLDAVVIASPSSLHEAHIGLAAAGPIG